MDCGDFCSLSAAIVRRWFVTTGNVPADLKIRITRRAQFRRASRFGQLFEFVSVPHHRAVNVSERNSQVRRFLQSYQDVGTGIYAGF